MHLENFSFNNFIFATKSKRVCRRDSVLIFSYISCFQKSILLDYNDSSDVVPVFPTWLSSFLRVFP